MCVCFFSSSFDLRIIYGSAWRLEQRQNLLKSALCNICDGSLGCCLQVSGWIFIDTQQCQRLFRGFSRRNEYKRHLLQCCVLLWGSARKYQFPANMNEINVAGVECDCFSSQQPDRKLNLRVDLCFVLPSHICCTASIRSVFPSFLYFMRAWPVYLTVRVH